MVEVDLHRCFIYNKMNKIPDKPVSGLLVSSVPASSGSGAVSTASSCDQA